MTQLRALPYLTPSPGAISVVSWYLLSGDSYYPLPDILPHWDAGTPVRVRAAVAIDAQRIYDECQLAPGDVLRVGLVWQCPGTSLRGKGSSIDLSDPASSCIPPTLDIMLEVEGKSLADRIIVETRLLLASTLRSEYSLAPSRPGNLLWSEQRTILLQGIGTRFPVELADFAVLPRVPEDAAWFLDWNSDDLNQMALGSMCLYINSRNQKMRRALEQKDPVGQIVSALIYFDLARTLIRGALANSDFVNDPFSYADNSIGAAIRRLVATLFHDESLAGLRQRALYEPELFDAVLQSRLKLFQEAGA